jgi:hypothetical protein
LGRQPLAFHQDALGLLDHDARVERGLELDSQVALAAGLGALRSSRPRTAAKATIAAESASVQPRGWWVMALQVPRIVPPSETGTDNTPGRPSGPPRGW